MRKIPTDENGKEIVPPPITPHLDRRKAGNEQVTLATQVRRYELISPLFGGGVEPGVPDPVTLIRAPEIRGQLRFWWRATRGGRFNGCLAEMKKREDEIWGAASTDRKGLPSKVQVTVQVTNAGKDNQVFVPRNRPAEGWRNLAYVAFPLQPQDQRPPGKVRVGVAFKLILTYPTCIKQDVEAALWAWETFGGVGARTRRGFGALKLVSVDGRPATLPDPRKVDDWIRQKIHEHLGDGQSSPETFEALKWPRGVPHLSLAPRMRITGTKPGPREAWEHLISRLKKFRQSRGGASGRGRSDWPEPDAIRDLMSSRRQRGASVIRKFPRAAFGLPVVFHFKGENLPDVTLQGKSYKRLASPLILRPLACDGGQAVGLALVLEGTGLAPGGLMLDKVPNVAVGASLTESEAADIVPLKGKQRPSDVLDAFLETL